MRSAESPEGQPLRARFSALLIKALQDENNPLHWKKCGACFVAPTIGGIALGVDESGRPKLGGFDVSSPHIQAGTRRWGKDDKQRSLYGFAAANAHPWGCYIWEASELRPQPAESPDQCPYYEDRYEGRVVNWRSELPVGGMNEEEFKRRCMVPPNIDALRQERVGERSIGNRMERDIRTHVSIYRRRVFSGEDDVREGRGMHHVSFNSCTSWAGIMPMAARGRAEHLMCYRTGYLRSFDEGFQVTMALGRERSAQMRRPQAFKDLVWWTDSTQLTLDACSDFLAEELSGDTRQGGGRSLAEAKKRLRPPSAQPRKRTRYFANT